MFFKFLFYFENVEMILENASGCSIMVCRLAPQDTFSAQNGVDLHDVHVI